MNALRTSHQNRGPDLILRSLSEEGPFPASKSLLVYTQTKSELGLKILRIVLPLLSALLITSAGLAADQPATKHRRICRGPWQGWGLIVPGVRFGDLRLGSDGAETLQKLDKPDATDSGMSQKRMVWKWSDQEIMFMHTENNGAINAQPTDGVTIDLIRFSYPGPTTYKTAQGISTGSTFQEIRQSFPGVQPVNNIPSVYDDEKDGIAFEFSSKPTDQSPCIAIMVHLPGAAQIATQSQVESLLADRAKH